MHVFLTGASGFIGSHLQQALQVAGHEVRAATRSQGFDFGRMLTEADWYPHLSGMEVVINTVGIIAEVGDQRFDAVHHLAPAALFRASMQAGVKRVIQVSALGADEQAFTPYQLSKRAADEVLRDLPLDWFVLRPSLVYGRGGKSSALFHRMAALPCCLWSAMAGRGYSRCM
ncbi:MAG: NAD(P)H-binding protein [Thiolinea sp.]